MSARTIGPHSTRARPPPRGGGFTGEPNPLLVRELRQSLRVPRLPWQISAVVALIGLGMLSIGSLEGPKGRPAQLGVGLFQGFVSLLLLYVVLVGPATAAGAIAQEREGKTLEPLLLTGLSAADVARGKFLAAFGTIALQVLAIFPLAAIPFLFGGVTTSELMVALLFVMLVAAVSVAFGLAVASRTQTLRGALAISIILPAAAAPALFSIVTLLGESVARKRWPFLPGAVPIWWATAYTNVPFGLDYVVWLILWPLLLLGLPFWLFGTLTASNLAGVNDDRSSGIKRWFVGATLAISAVVFVTCFRIDLSSAVGVAIGGQVIISLLLAIMVVLLVAEPLAPSRLVRARWARTRAGVLTRMLGPGLMRGAALQIACACVLLAAVYAGGVLGSSTTGLRQMIGVASGTTARATVGGALAIVVLYTLMFQVFLVGFSSFLRTRRSANAAATARAWTIAVAVIAIIVPGVLATIVRSFDRNGSEADLFAAPSPAFAYYAFEKELRRMGDSYDVTVAALSAALCWGATGLVLLGVAWERSRRAISLDEKSAEATSRKLAQEDEEDEDDDADDHVLHQAPAPPPLPGTEAIEGADEKDKDPA